MQLAISPCPNDTFIFHAWIHGLLPEAPMCQVTFADIGQTNHLISAPDCPYDVMKISYGALPWLPPHYGIVPCGGALGHNCGPLLVRLRNDEEERALVHSRIAIPDDRSTAYLLLKLWFHETYGTTPPHLIRMPYDQIMPALAQRTIDAGLLIHEARFVYPSWGCEAVCDLGHWWEQTSGCPIPLGAIVVNRHIDATQITACIRQSLAYAHTYPEASIAFVLHHAQHRDRVTVDAHIALYVNAYTHDLGVQGKKAVSTLFLRAQRAGIVPHVAVDSFFL